MSYNHRVHAHVLTVLCVAYREISCDLKKKEKIPAGGPVKNGKTDCLFILFYLFFFFYLKRDNFILYLFLVFVVVTVSSSRFLFWLLSGGRREIYFLDGNNRNNKNNTYSREITAIKIRVRDVSSCAPDVFLSNSNSKS